MNLQGGEHRWIDLLNGQEVRGLIAREATIVGPAVIVPMQGTRIHDCTWDTQGGGFEDVVWEVDAARDKVIGAVALWDCDFESCTFIMTGIGLHPEGVANMARQTRAI